MEAVVADSYINKSADSQDAPYAFLVGDAAHAFPPSGGFGMNTGIGDAFNLAHKISVATSAASDAKATALMLRKYDLERRYAGNMTKDLALINYQKSLKVAQMLRLDKGQAETFTWAVDNALSFVPFVDKKSVLRMGLDLGLVMAEKSLELTD